MNVRRHSDAMVKALIFDLDGTLLNTLSDITAAVNDALTRRHFPSRSEEEVRSFIGNGARRLIERAAPPDSDSDTVSALLADFRSYYAAHPDTYTRPYDGIDEAIGVLRARGYRIAVVSNKFDAAVQLLCDRFFKETVYPAIGESSLRPRKPAPDGVFLAAEMLGVPLEECVYIGDSDVDVLTAKNAQMPCLGCAWGFCGADALRAAGLAADSVLYHPRELCDRFPPLDR